MLTRILALVKKEFIHLRNDWWMPAFMVFGGVLELLAIGCATSRPISNLPLMILDQDKSASSRAVVTALDNTGTFALEDQDADGWVLDIIVRQATDSTILIQRTIAQDESFQNVWSGFLTSTETAALDTGTYRLIGLATNSTTDEERQIVRRFNVSKSWVD